MAGPHWWRKVEMSERNYQELVRLLPVLPILAELGRTGHITETAEGLGIPQSTVSRALSRAAAVVGTQLVVRDGRGIRLTPAAELLIPRIEAALVQVQAGLDEVRLQGDATRGRISVAFQYTFGEAMLPLMIREFRLRHPAVTFELIQGPRSLCLDSLAQARVDLAIISPVPQATRSLRAELLYIEPLRLVVPEQHPFAARRSIRLEEARSEGFVVLSEGFGLRSIFEALCRQAGFRPRITFEGQDSHTLRGLVSAGLGISVLPPAGADHLTPVASSLGWKELAIEAPVAQRGIGLAWRLRADEPEQVRLFRELVLGEGRPLLQDAFSGAGARAARAGG